MSRRLAMVLAAHLGLGLVAGASEPGASSYVGSDRCRDCHAEKYRGWQQTFHATVVQDAKANPSAIKGNFRAPDLGFSLGDVEYTIGGHRDQRYMKKIGDDYYVLPKLWSVQGRRWLPNNVWGWKKMPYSRYCKGCHVTAYSPQEGTVAEPRIGCEACHGPGWEHAASEGRKPIVNPRELPEDRREMICAACHVRGSDPSARYSFPLGFTPGQDLGPLYVPVDKTDEETNAQAILRGFAKWKKQREEGQQGKCEVCGIPGMDQPKKAEPEDANTFCYGCHDVKARYAQHTRHAAATRLACFDCHVPQTKKLMNTAPEDIHSYGYFLVHAEQCYDRDIAKACAKCHADRGLDWARETVETWGKPLPLDH